jgi:hypothetical protein
MLCVFCKASAQNELPFNTLNLQTLKDFKPTAGNWKVAGDVFYDLNQSGKGVSKSGTGILVNTPTEKAKDHLFTNFQHGDIELELDFMMDKGSNAGVYLQGRYEIQMFDSWGVANPKVTDCGAIYQRWDETKPEDRKGYDGHAPSQNVSKAPGLWQHYKIAFQAPRFDAKGAKIANAKFVKVFHNGVLIHENVELTGPTRAAAFEDEKPMGPLMIQGDHGAVAIKNIKYKAYGTEPVKLTNLHLKAYDGRFRSLSALAAATPAREADIDLLAHTLTSSRDSFGGVITGKIYLPQSGKYALSLNLRWIPQDTDPRNPNGAGELLIGGKKVLSIEAKNGGIASTTQEFKAGEYPFTLNYYKTYGLWYARGNDIVLGIEGPGVPYTVLNAVIPEVEAVGPIRVMSKGEPVMLRSFVNHQDKKRTHVISVGEGNTNYSFDLKTGEFLQFWRGDFLETTPMWHGRGETQLAVPMGSVIQTPGKPSLAFLNDQNTAWPDSNSTYNYNGYDVEAGRPVIKYSVGEAMVREAFIPEEGGKKLTHSFAVAGKGNSNLWCKVVEGKEVEKLDNGLYAIDGKEFYVDLGNIQNPIIRSNSKNSKELLIPVTDKVQYSIIW